jgi:hypothetical protein
VVTRAKHEKVYFNKQIGWGGKRTAQRHNSQQRIYEAVKKRKRPNEWARRIYERKQLSEAFVSLPHHTGLESYFIITELKKRFIDKFGEDSDLVHVDDKARKLPTNPFFGGLKKQEDEGEDDEDDRRFASIVVQDKHNPDRNQSIFELSMPLQQLSKKNINIVRFYISHDMKDRCYEKIMDVSDER